MEKLKLYMVYHLGKSPCWNLRIALSPEQALTQCFDQTQKPKLGKDAERSCRVEEVKFEGYKLTIQKA